MKSYSIKCGLILLVAYLFMTSCSGQSEATNITTTPVVTPPPTPTPVVTANTCSTPTHSVLWAGERSTATTVSVRGAWSDIQIRPGTTQPSSVYVDAGCSCVKYTYWTGSAWRTEIIAAGNSTSYTYIRLAYLSTGLPIVIWSNSTTTLQLAIRQSADHSQSGNWSLSSLDTAGTAIRSLEIKVNPADQVAILYARNTAGSSHLVLCTTGCQSVLNYSAPSTTLGTVGTTPHSMGLAWCNSGSNYYPVVALTGATNSTYAVCRQSTLSSCLSGIANWAGGAQQTFTGSGANRATVQLAIDATIVDAPVRAILQNGSALAYYQSSFAGGGCANGTVGAIASGGTISGTSANSGNAYLSLVQVTGNNYHLVANESTTSVRYYNTTTGSFTAWNAQGTIATATLAAAGSTRGGLAVDESLTQAYTTFARTSAAGPFNGNLSFGWVEDTSVASNNVAAIFSETPLTLDGQIQSLTNQVPNISVTTTSTNQPAVAFVDYSANATTAGVLKMGFRNGSLATDSWSFRSLPIVSQPQSLHMIYDNNNKPWIGFFDQQTLRFRLATNTQADGSGTWTSYNFPFATAVTAATAPAYHAVSVALDLTVSPAQPILIVGIANHATVANTGVWAAKLNPTNGTWSTAVQLESTNLANSISNLTSDYDSTGNIVIAYFDRSANNRVEYIQSTNGGNTWSTSTAVSLFTGHGAGAKIKLNPSNSRPAISYYDKANNRVYLSTCTTSLSTCSNLANWSNTYVDNLMAGVSTLAASSDGLLNTGLTFTSTGTAYITYPSASGNNGVLAINNNGSGSFPLPSTLLSANNANITQNPTLSAINFGQSGWNVDSVRTSSGSLHSVYIGPGNWLYLTSCGD